MIWHRLHLLLLLLLMKNTPTEQVTLLIVSNGRWGRRPWYFVKGGHPLYRSICIIMKNMER